MLQNFFINTLPLFQQYPWAWYIAAIAISFIGIIKFWKWIWPDELSEFIEKVGNLVKNTAIFIRKNWLVFILTIVIIVIALIKRESLKMLIDDKNANKYYLICTYLSPDNKGKYFISGEQFITNEKITENQNISGRFKKTKVVINLNVKYLSIESIKKLKNFKPDIRNDDKIKIEKWRGTPLCSELDQYDLEIKREYYRLIKKELNVKRKNEIPISPLEDDFNAVSRDSSSTHVTKYLFVDEDFRLRPREVKVALASSNNSKLPSKIPKKIPKKRLTPSSSPSLSTNSGLGTSGDQPKLAQQPAEQPKQDYSTELRKFFEDAAKSRRGFSSRSGLGGFAHGSEVTILLSGNGGEDGKNIKCDPPTISYRKALAFAYCELLDDEGGPALRRKVGQILDKINDGNIVNDISVIVSLFSSE